MSRKANDAFIDLEKGLAHLAAEVRKREVDRRMVFFDTVMDTLEGTSHRTLLLLREYVAQIVGESIDESLQKDKLERRVKELEKANEKLQGRLDSLSALCELCIGIAEDEGLVRPYDPDEW